jgi:hypothetical protein
LHEQNLRLQRTSRIELRRRRILYLRQFDFSTEIAAEIRQMQDEIRAEGEEP